MRMTDLDFPSLMKRIEGDFRTKSRAVHTERWQGTDISKKPEMMSYELGFYHIEIPLSGESLALYRSEIKPNLPWADDHFAERVCGAPINPGIEWKNWPWGDSAGKFIEEGGMFNHNYMMRYWPKLAGNKVGPTKTVKEWDEALEQRMTLFHAYGIGENYGDLNDVVELLAQQPLTRQAYIPIFFPEDTGIGDGGRKPCTLGYQFIMRDGYLSVFYPLRSCDYIRHFRDDVYLTIRLLLWVLQELRKRDPNTWNKVKPGRYVMDITSFHIFKNDWQTLFGEKRNEA